VWSWSALVNPLLYVNEFPCFGTSTTVGMVELLSSDRRPHVVHCGRLLRPLAILPRHHVTLNERCVVSNAKSTFLLETHGGCSAWRGPRNRKERKRYSSTKRNTTERQVYTAPWHAQDYSAVFLCIFIWSATLGRVD
jgi:hypothetical protein